MARFNEPLTVPRKSLGTFGVLGGEITVEGQWIPDPEVEANVMMEIAGHLANTARPLLASAAIARGDTQERFDTETDPSGESWAPLDPDYLESKVAAGYPEDILQRTTDLKKAATSGAAWYVDEQNLVFNTGVLPSYGLIHQVGSGEENVGDAFNWRETVRSHRASRKAGELSDFEAGGAHDSLGIGRGNALPARPFIGLSDEAIAEIALLFDQWFDEAQEIFVHPRTGVAQSVIRTSRGPRFGPKIHGFRG